MRLIQKHQQTNGRGRGKIEPIVNDATRIAGPAYVPELGETKKETGGTPMGAKKETGGTPMGAKKETGGTPMGDFGLWAGEMLEHTPDWVPFQQLLRGLGQYLQTDRPTEEELKLIKLQQMEAADKRLQEHPYAGAAVAGLLGFLME